MLSLTSFLLLKLLWFRGSFRKKIVQRCRVRSCLWTRRKVLWLHSGLSRSEYVLDTLQSSMNVRANWGKKVNERTEGMFSIIAAVSELLGKRLSCPTRYLGNMFSSTAAVSELCESVRKRLSYPTRYLRNMFSVISAGLELTLQISMNARANWGKKANERTEGMFPL